MLLFSERLQNAENAAVCKTRLKTARRQTTEKSIGSAYGEDLCKLSTFSSKLLAQSVRNQTPINSIHPGTFQEPIGFSVSYQCFRNGNRIFFRTGEVFTAVAASRSRYWSHKVGWGWTKSWKMPRLLRLLSYAISSNSSKSCHVVDSTWMARGVLQSMPLWNNWNPGVTFASPLQSLSLLMNTVFPRNFWSHCMTRYNLLLVRKCARIGCDLDESLSYRFVSDSLHFSNIRGDVFPCVFSFCTVNSSLSPPIR